MDDWKQVHWKPEQGEKEMRTVQIGRNRTEGISTWDIGKNMCMHFSLQPGAGAKVTDSHFSSTGSEYIWNTPATFPTSSWCQSTQSIIPSTAVCYHSSVGDLYSGYQKFPCWLVACQRSSVIPHYGISASFQLALFKSKEIIPPDLAHRNITHVNEVFHSLKIPTSKSLV